MKKLYLVGTLMLALIAGLSFLVCAQSPTANEILNLVEEKSIMGSDIGSMIVIVKFEVTTAESEASSYTFKVFSVRGLEDNPDWMLIAYLEPDLVSGTLFLTSTLKEGDARMWLYLPALQLTKELISEEAQGQELIAGSGISRKDIAQGFQYKEDYTPELVGQGDQRDACLRAISQRERGT